MKVSSPQQPLPQIPDLPSSIPPPPVIQGQIQGSKPQAKSLTPSFLGTASVPSQMNKGAKQLMGQ